MPHSHDLVSLLDVSSRDGFFSPEVCSHLSVTEGQCTSLCSHSEMAWLELSNCCRLICQSPADVFRYARRSRGHVLDCSKARDGLTSSFHSPCCH